MYATTLPTSNWLRRASIRLAWYRHMPASSLSCFGMRKFVITETLWSSVIFKTLMVSLHRGRFVVVHLYSNFSVDPKNFPIGANIYQKLRFFTTFQAGPTFLKPEWWNLVWRCALRQAKFYKNCLRCIPLLGKFIPKITNFGDNGEIWQKYGAWDSVPCEISWKSLKGIIRFWANLYRKLSFLPNFGAISLHL